jgi:hypothetical protein
LKRLVLASLVSVGLMACGDDANTSVDAGATDAGDAAADVDAATEAQAMIGASGGTLELGELHFVLPENAITDSSVTLRVSMSDEDPGVGDVTRVTHLYEFGPAGTTFETDVFVSFDVPGLAEGDIPLVYWTNDEGAFEEQGTWWSEGRVHTLTRHLSRAFVGTTRLPRLSMLCRSQPTVGRGVCLKSAPVATNGEASFVETRGLVATLAEGTTGTLTVRETPLHPGALGLPSLLTIYDVDGNEISALDNNVEICFRGTLTEGQLNDTACLGYYDESRGAWGCQDECLEQRGDMVCGKTDHFTSFAILLTGREGSTTRDPCGIN